MHICVLAKLMSLFASAMDPCNLSCSMRAYPVPAATENVFADAGTLNGIQELPRVDRTDCVSYYCEEMCAY